jgi:D-alanyl-D-alanine carboxypeptidase/D-alanyl-D-alanine-endopeptidase (penicillin-binding protein 4)
MKFRTTNNLRQLITLNSALLILITSCSVEKRIAKSAKADVLDAKALQTAHVGISIFDPATNNYLYNYQGDKYFVPASNTKIPTCYAAMKYLGDSLVGLKYSLGDGKNIVIEATGDPTFLHPDFKIQRVHRFLSQVEGRVSFSESNWSERPLGTGWSWNDYTESYMAERSLMPMYGNIVMISGKLVNLKVEPSFFKHRIMTNPVKNEMLVPNIDSFYAASATRRMQENNFGVEGNKTSQNEIIKIPFHTRELGTLFQMLKDTLKNVKEIINAGPSYQYDFSSKIHSQPTDSLLKPMMHRSDNFFAEQSLLMVSNELLGVMNDAKIIDTILKTDFKDLPQKPRWVDGSGLSRYNLFTPQDFVAILNKMQKEFPMERIKEIFPTGGEGTISSYYKSDSGYIYGKTGTLSGVVAFSGFLYTKKGKLLIFSTLVNNHQASATDVRRTIEKFLQDVRNKY